MSYNMQFAVASWLIVLLMFVNHSEEMSRNKICYQAKTCIHTGRERCGLDSSGNVRRFLDSCDIMEFNCLKGTDFKKTTYSKCQNQPPIDEQVDLFNHTITKHESNDYNEDTDQAQSNQNDTTNGATDENLDTDSTTTTYDETTLDGDTTDLTNDDETNMNDTTTTDDTNTKYEEEEDAPGQAGNYENDDNQ